MRFNLKKNLKNIQTNTDLDAFPNDVTVKYTVFLEGIERRWQTDWTFLFERIAKRENWSPNLFTTRETESWFSFFFWDLGGKLIYEHWNLDWVGFSKQNIKTQKHFETGVKLIFVKTMFLRTTMAKSCKGFVVYSIGDWCPVV